MQLGQKFCVACTVEYQSACLMLMCLLVDVMTNQYWPKSSYVQRCNCECHAAKHATVTETPSNQYLLSVLETHGCRQRKF